MFVDFVFYYGAYVWNFEIGVKSVIRHIPRCVRDGSKYFRLTSLHNYHVGLASTSPENGIHEEEIKSMLRKLVKQVTELQLILPGCYRVIIQKTSLVFYQQQI
jgi:hypothetical protein